MKLIWSEFAKEALSDIFKYYKKAAGIKVATKIKADIFISTKQLVNQPFSGQIEMTLEQLGEGPRYLVCGNYKIVYKQVEEGILISDVFNTRQNPI